LKSRVTGDVEGFTADKIGNEREFDFGLVPPPDGRTKFRIPELGGVKIDFSPTMRHMQFWSLPGKDFVCLEPFYGPTNTINTDRRVDVPAGLSEELWMRIELEE
jgi:galactose mutarotase-like enzyme